MEKEVINIPKTLIAKHKRDKNFLDLLALSLIMKCNFSSSAMKNASWNKVHDIAGVGLNKSRRLFKAAKQCDELFSYNEKNNILTARTFSANKEVSYTKGGKKILSLYCIKFANKKDYTLKNIISLFRDNLLLCAVNAQEHANDQFPIDGFLNKNSWCKKRKPMTEKVKTSIIGMSRSSLYRITKRLENAGDIKKTPAQFHLATSTLNENDLKKYADWFLIKDEVRKISYFVRPAILNIERREINARFQNIIYNHKDRQTTCNKVLSGLSDIEKYELKYSH